MALPLKYNLRHVFRRWKTTSMTVFAIALVVAMFVCVLALANGLSQAFVATGDALNVMCMRKGSTSETNSTVRREEFYEARYLEGVALGADGQPLAVLETLNLASLAKASGGNSNAIVRGAQPSSLSMRGNMRLVEGRMFEPGVRELIVGTGASSRFANAKVGDSVRLSKSEWTVVGRFDAARSAYDSEFWGDVDLLNREFDRSMYSSMLLHAKSEADVPKLMAAVESNQRLSNLKARTEVDYYREQTKSSAPIQFLGMLISVIMSVGAVFAAMNAMYASVSGRAWEIGTLRVLGFSRRSVLVSFAIESVLIGLAGGVLGGIIALPINGVTTGTTSFTTFSEIAFAFRITPGLFVAGIVFAGTIGFVGGLIPALQASRMPIIESLRQNA